MMKIKDWIQLQTAELRRANIASAQLDAELLLCDALDVNREWLITHSEDTVPQNTAIEAMRRRLNREPLAYIRGWKEFYGRQFNVNSSVLIPRPESETIIEIIKELPQEHTKILDIGTGSGALAITAALEIPRSIVSACDISDTALKVAEENAKKLNANVTFISSDLVSNIHDQYDIIIANLPYVDKSWQRSPETSFEPSLALFAEEDGLGLIKQLIVQIKSSLSPNGYLLLEADPRQHEALLSFAKEYGLQEYTKKDFIIVLKKV